MSTETNAKIKKKKKSDSKLINAGSSIAGAIGTGLNAGLGRGFKIGGVGTMATMAGLGAATGLGVSAMTDGEVNPIASAGIGAVAGAVALPAAGFAAGAFGNAAVGAAKMVPGIAAGVGQAALNASPFAAAVGTQVATSVGSSIWNVGKRMINWNEAADAFEKIKFTNPLTGAQAGWKNNKGIKKVTGAASGAVVNGVTMLGATSFIEGMKNAFNTVQKAKMGQMVGIDTVAPRVPSYADNAGATGDLVFALNANRRG